MVIFGLGAAINGRRLVLCGGTVTLRLHRYPFWKFYWKEGKAMSVIDLIAVISFGLTCFIAGYNLGKDRNKTEK